MKIRNSVMGTMFASILSRQPVTSSFQLSHTKNHEIFGRRKCRGALAVLGLHSSFLGCFSALVNYKGSQAEAAAQRSSQQSTASLELPFPDFSAESNANKICRGNWQIFDYLANGGPI